MAAAMNIDELFPPEGDGPPAIPAATLVIFRNDPAGGPPQLLMVERSAEMRFAGGAAVFPGGRVDDADLALAAQLGAEGLEEVEEQAARIAALREALEETGLAVGLHQRPSIADALRARALLLEQGELAPVLEAMGWTLDLDGLVPFARWRPKHREVRVFDTRFYLTDLGSGQVELLVDATENTHLFWASASEALRLADAGQIKVIFPTRRNLERLALFANFGEALVHVAQFPSRMISPFAEQRDGETWLCIPSDAGYPVSGEPLQKAARG
jgi:8-oxo-dGTP pyrophosphatase MutT (NUDIX family)